MYSIFICIASNLLRIVNTTHNLLSCFKFDGFLKPRSPKSSMLSAKCLLIVLSLFLYHISNKIKWCQITSLLRYGATTNKNFGANLGKITNFNHPSIEREFYLYLASKLDNYECCTIYLHTFIHTWLGQKKFSCVKQRIENIWKIKLGSCTLHYKCRYIDYFIYFFIHYP